MKIGPHIAPGAVLNWLTATTAIIFITALLDHLHVHAVTGSILYLLIVVLTAAFAERWLSYYVSLLCVFAIDYYFFPPYYTLRVSNFDEWLALFAFLSSSIVVSRVAEHARLQARHADARRADVERLYELSQEMMLREDAGKFLRDLPRLIGRIFALEGVILYFSDRDQFYSSHGGPPESLMAAMRNATLNHHYAIEENAGYQVVPFLLGLRAVGSMAWRPDALSREVAAAIGAEVAIVLARYIAIEASARMEAAREGERLHAALIDSLTHELRTPLTSILAAATTLREGQGLDEAGRQDMVAILNEEATRLDLLIGEAVEMAEIDANVLQIRSSPQNPRNLLEQAVEETRKILAGHNVTIEAEETIEPAWLDARLLNRVLRHLLENAANHTPAGTQIRLHCWRAGSRLEFSVEDDGPGIDARDLPLIFQKFYRGIRGAGSRKGTGMGLAIVRAILTAHGGGIEADSPPGKGACFRFWVPLVTKELDRNEQGAGKSNRNHPMNL